MPYQARVVAFRATWVVIAVAALAACGQDGRAAQPSPAPPSSARATAAPAPSTFAGAEVIDFAGVDGVALGSTKDDLVAAGLVDITPAKCGGTQFTRLPYASPVFDHDRLVLIWAYPPLHTPERAGVGTPLQQARSAYPGAQDLTPPAGALQYAGLLVPGGGDRAYLLLHDGAEVRKLIVGYESAVRELFRTGFGTC